MAAAEEDDGEGMELGAHMVFVSGNEFVENPWKAEINSNIAECKKSALASRETTAISVAVVGKANALRKFILTQIRADARLQTDYPNLHKCAKDKARWAEFYHLKGSGFTPTQFKKLLKAANEFYKFHTDIDESDHMVVAQMIYAMPFFDFTDVDTIAASTSGDAQITGLQLQVVRPDTHPDTHTHSHTHSHTASGTEGKKNQGVRRSQEEGVGGQGDYRCRSGGGEAVDERPFGFGAPNQLLLVRAVSVRAVSVSVSVRAVSVRAVSVSEGAVRGADFAP